MVRKKHNPISIDSLYDDYKVYIEGQMSKFMKKPLSKAYNNLVVCVDNGSSYEDFTLSCDIFIKKYASHLQKLNIYSEWKEKHLKFSINVIRMTTTFLSKKISVDTYDVIDILKELKFCLDTEIIFYKQCSELEMMSNGRSLKYTVLIGAICEMDKISTLISNKIDSDNFDYGHLKIVNNMVKSMIKKNKVGDYETDVFVWKTITNKISEYVIINGPFSLSNITQISKVSDIIDGLLKLVKDDRDVYASLFEKRYYVYNIPKNISKLRCLMINVHYLNDLIRFIEETRETLNVNNEYEKLKLINDRVYENYNTMTTFNKYLEMNNLHGDSTYLKNISDTLILESKYYDICSNIRRFLYYKTIKSYKGRAVNMKHKSVKCSLLNILNDDAYHKKINNVVSDVNEIVIRTYMFIKLYTIYCYENNLPIPDVTDIDFISMCVRTISINDPRGANMSDDSRILLSKLTKFYDEHMTHIYDEKCTAVGLSQILSSCKIEIVTAFKNNITKNYIRYVKHYMFSALSERYVKKYVELDESEKTKFKKELKICINKFIHCLLSNKSFEIDLMDQDLFVEWYNKEKDNLFPTNIQLDRIEDDIQKNPNKYFRYMLYMSNGLENMHRKQFNCFPLRTSAVPSSITLDTVSLITLFSQSNDGNPVSKLLKDNLDLFKHHIWNNIFSLETKYFKWSKNYRFNYSIKTDGISVTILFVHNDLDGVDLKDKISNDDKFKYIDDLGKMDDRSHSNEKMMKELKELSKKYKFVYNDPGKNPDILYMCDDENNFFRYTTKERLHELETLKHRRVIQRYKKQHEEIGKAEKVLSDYTSKTCNFESFKHYVLVKHVANEILIKYYKIPFLRKLRLRAHINRLRSESKLVNKINNKFLTDARDILLVYGDWSRSSQMRGCISTPCIGLKRRLAEDFKILNFDEFRTSCLDNITFKGTNNACVKGKDGKTKKLHSVLVSKILKNIGGKTVELDRFQNRNRNAVINFKNIMDHYIKTGIRKPEFSRSNK